MQPLTTKEFNYISDLLAAEDLLVKTCVIASSQATKSDTQQFLHHVIGEHQRRHDELVMILQQHEPVAH